MSRYNSIKTVYKGLNFDSKTEESWYKELEKLQEKGDIFNLRIQEEYLLQDGFRLDHDKGKIQDICYLADMVYEDKEGITHITDVKGSLFNIEQTFLLKFKLLKFIHRNFKYHVVLRLDDVWYDIERKEEKKQYQFVVAEKKRIAKEKRDAKAKATPKKKAVKKKVVKKK